MTVVIEDEIQGPAAARNAGIRQSKGQYLAFIDSDMIAEDQWLEKALRKIRTEGVNCFGCDIRILTSGSKTSFWETYELSSSLPVEMIINEKGLIPTGCLVIDRAVVAEIGLFDTRLLSAEDIEYGFRLRQNGFELRYVGNIQLYHPSRSSFYDFIKQHMKFGMGQYLIRKYHPMLFGDPKDHLKTISMYPPANPVVVGYRSLTWDTLDLSEKCLVYVLASITKAIRLIGFLKYYIIYRGRDTI